ncbi:Asp-tRNA(Asn)/Glu-tRNA(Gln) amidotransferase subunit GatB, partial [bacterium]
MEYRPTIGLEIHAELKTRTKMFCDSANDPDESRPNVHICPICLAHPGTLPVINREAVRHVLRLGVAVGGTLADFTEFDRKSYFYPDIPKGYQISQYERPLVSGGELAGVAITRVHLEEDTARSIHVAAKSAEGGSPDASQSETSRGKSLVDFNRAGIPLMELVTEPVITDAETAGRFARELQLLLRTLGAGEANLEKGEMRIEANISVQKTENSTQLGTKVEVKNINSFRSVERAIVYEIGRQTKLLEEGGKVVQETRGWDESKQETFH